MNSRLAVIVFSCCFAAFTAADAQISVQDGADGTAVTSLAGQMSVPNGLAPYFPVIDTENFKCSLVGPVADWLQNRAKPGAVLAAIVSKEWTMSLDKEAGLPILATFVIKASDGTEGVMVVMPGVCQFKTDISAGAVVRSGRYDIEAKQAIKAGGSLPVLYSPGPIIFSVRATDLKAGSKAMPLVRVLLAGTKVEYLGDYIRAWHIETRQ
jgi:hypothetical protein